MFSYFIQVLKFLQYLPVSERLELIREINDGMENVGGESKWACQQDQGQENLHF